MCIFVMVAGADVSSLVHLQMGTCCFAMWERRVGRYVGVAGCWWSGDDPSVRPAKLFGPGGNNLEPLWQFYLYICRCLWHFYLFYTKRIKARGPNWRIKNSLTIDASQGKWFFIHISRGLVECELVVNPWWPSLHEQWGRLEGGGDKVWAEIKSCLRRVK